MADKVIQDDSKLKIGDKTPDFEEIRVSLIYKSKGNCLTSIDLL